MNYLFRKIKTAKNLFRQSGWSAISKRIKYNNFLRREEQKYSKWVKLYDTLDDKDRALIREKISRLKKQPKISVLLPVYNVEEKFLRRAVESVLGQLYENWELCIAEDHSPSPHVAKVLREYAKQDSRIKTVFRETNGHISAASNSALEIASGEYAALLDHDDELAEHALYLVAAEINAYPETDLIYSDEDKIDENGRRFAPNFKPDYSPDLLRSLNLFTHLSVYRTEVLKRIGGFRLGTEGAQDYDLALRFTEKIPEKSIRHIPQILYHWRAIKGSTALASKEKSYAYKRSREVLEDFLKRKSIRATISEGFADYHRINYELPEILPKISLISVARENDENVFSLHKNLLDKTDYENIELLLGLDPADKKSDVSVENAKIKIAENAGNNRAGNYNRLAEKAEGEILVFLDAAFSPVKSDWLKELTSLVHQPEIGAAGAKVIYQDGTIRNSGVILGFDGILGFAHRNFPKSVAGNLARAQIANNFSAISGALATRRETFQSLSGFDETNFADGLFEIDFCLRLRRKSLRVVFTPFAELVQLTASSAERILQQKNIQEIKFFKQRWESSIKNDEFYNPSFAVRNATFALAFPPRNLKPWVK